MPTINNTVHEPQQPSGAAQQDQENPLLTTPPAKGTPEAPPNQKAAWERSKNTSMRQPRFD
jgi:hypothetical protein